MASSSLIFAIWAIIFASYFSSVQPPNCTSHKLLDKKVFANCTDLPTSDATLHYSYNATNNSLPIAYVATPARLSPWVSRATNPTGQGMVGAQAIIPFESKYTVDAMAYNLSSYKLIEESKPSFEGWDLSAVEPGGRITIPTAVKVPGKADGLNQEWQVGQSLTNGRLDEHEFTPANLTAKSTLSRSTTTSAGENTTTTTGSDESGVVSETELSFGFVFGSVLLVASLC